MNIPEKGPGKFSGANLLLVLGEGKWNNARGLKQILQQMFENENGSNTVQHMCTTQQTKISCNKRYGEKQFISPTSKFQKKLFGGDKVLWKRKPLDPLLWGFPPKFKHDDLENVSAASNMAILGVYC